MELLIVYALCVGVFVYILGWAMVLGFVLGMLTHGAFRPARFSVPTVSAGIALLMLALARVPLFSAIGFFLGLLGYGWFYWSDAQYTGQSASMFWRTSIFWRWLARLFGHRRVSIDDMNGMVYDAQPWTTGAQALYVFHPHGMMVYGTLLTILATREMNPFMIFIGAHWLIFALPGLREAALALGCVDADRHVLRKLLSLGYSVAVVPEGTRAHAPRLTKDHKPRDGFIQLAYDASVPLVLCETPVELHTYMVFEPRVLDRIRAAFLRAGKYAFPTFFLLRLPLQPLITYSAVVERPHASRNRRQQKKVQQLETRETFAKRATEIRGALQSWARISTEAGGWDILRQIWSAHVQREADVQDENQQELDTDTDSV